MIPQKNQNTLVSNAAVGKKMDIEMSSKAAHILSSLYINKPKAIVRELGCNAYDSHVDAGRGDIPFEVTLPTDIEPWLTIKDTGLGLSEEQFETIYTTYFKSTKTDSNSVDGMMGIGSKSPFSYTNQFVVVATHDGVARTFQMYKDEDEFPSFTKISEQPSDAHNGVEIRVPVKRNDIWEFKKAVYETYQWFDVPPVITNGERVEKIEIDQEKPYTLLRGYGRPKGVYALMGNVLYDIKLSEVIENSYADFLANNAMVILPFERGMLNFLPSRESISFNKVTTQNCKDRIEEMVGMVVSDVQEEVEAKADLREVGAEFGGDFVFDHLVERGDLTFRGKKIRDLKVFDPEEKLSELMEGYPTPWWSETHKRLRTGIKEFSSRGSTKKSIPFTESSNALYIKFNILVKDDGSHLVLCREAVFTHGYKNLEMSEKVFEDFKILLGESYVQYQVEYQSEVCKRDSVKQEISHRRANQRKVSGYELSVYDNTSEEDETGEFIMGLREIRGKIRSYIDEGKTVLISGGNTVRYKNLLKPNTVVFCFESGSIRRKILATEEGVRLLTEKELDQDKVHALRVDATKFAAIDLSIQRQNTEVLRALRDHCRWLPRNVYKTIDRYFRIMEKGELKNSSFRAYRNVGGYDYIPHRYFDQISEKLPLLSNYDFNTASRNGEELDEKTQDMVDYIIMKETKRQQGGAK